MIVLTWLLLIAPVQKEELFDAFLSAFLAQDRFRKKNYPPILEREDHPSDRKR